MDPGPGDLDNDGDVDAAGFATLANCPDGPGVAPGTGMWRRRADGRQRR